MKVNIIRSKSEKTIGIFYNKYYHQITCTLDDTDVAHVKILDLTDIVCELVSKDVIAHRVGTLLYTDGGAIQVQGMAVDAVETTSNDLKAIIQHIETGAKLVETFSFEKPKKPESELEPAEFKPATEHPVEDSTAEVKEEEEPEKIVDA
ncbi:hypothetical protein HMPREF3034_00031 [Prevotella sp. DNF00663]|uniref:hypothetical protein n=1 Tax=Prevotella sp. DNF00663 TaxID=1384078 RepID=UPI000785DD33|nr:hypothetical protein [Prevotella sp. DNF00663]KXB86083.1 hypothetical protein HMPREF3034_00031 [Prevotella sp. DNF00663]